MQTLAHAIANHPFLSFAALALLMLSLSAAGWWAVQRGREPLWQCLHRGWQHVLARPPVQALFARYPRLRTPRYFAGSYLLLDLLAGFAIVAAALTVFLEIADEIEVGEPLGRFDDLLAGELRASLTTTGLRAYALVTHLGDTAMLVALGAGVALLLCWRRQPLLAAVWVAALAGNGLLNRLLKALFERTRPLHEHGWASAQGWSFPSGHSSGAMVAYGMLAYLLIRRLPAPWHLPIALGAITVILLVGFSRIVLQVHYFSDVLAGYASGGAWLLCCMTAAELALRRGPPSRQ